MQIGKSGIASCVCWNRRRDGIRCLLLPLLVLWILALAPGCEKKKLDSPIRIGTTPWATHELLHLAKLKGFFDAEGLKVELVELSTIGDIRRAYERGQIDVAPLTCVEILMIREQPDRSPKIFGIEDYSNGADMLLAQPAIKDLAGLRGKRIAIEPGTLDCVAVSAALKTAGLTLRDVTIVPMPHDRMAEAYAAGQIDAAETYPPFSIDLLKGAKANRLSDSARFPGLIADLLVADASLLAARPEQLAGILRAGERAYQYMLQHPDEAHKYMAGREKITPAEFKESLGGIHIVSLDEMPAMMATGGTLEKTIKTTDDILRQVGLLKGPDRTSDCIDRAPVQRAAKK